MKIINSMVQRYTRDLFASEHWSLESTKGITLSAVRASSNVPPDHRLSLFTSIVDNSPNAVVITDACKNIIYVNHAFERVSGYKPDEVLGRNPRILKSERTPPEIYKDLNQTLNSGRVWKGEFVNTHPDGFEYIEEAAITPIFDGFDEIAYFVAEKKNITKQKVAETNIERLVNHDDLTGLANRTYFIEQAKMLTSTSTNPGDRFSVLFADMDRFKELNDTRGHLAGDKALKEVARRFQHCLSPEDFIARIGGDEFVVLHYHTSETSTADLAKKLAKTLSEPVMIEKQEFFLGVSIGSSSWPKDARSLIELLACADLAMYKAKLTGVNYTFYEQAMGNSFQREFALSRKLLAGLQSGQFHLVYQPKIEISTGEVAGFEALMRWHEPEFGTISPLEFIPIAEKHHYMCELGKWLMTHACNQINIWKREGIDCPGRMAINISVLQLMHPEFCQNMTDIVESAGLSPTLFELEVTESVLMNDPERARVILARLEEVGFTIAIDDFGTGYSSLSYLKKLNASTLKIDKSFISELTTDLGDQTIVKSIIELGSNFNMTVVAEGVETRAQWEGLKVLNCDVVQGYYCYKPMSGKELSEVIVRLDTH